MDYKTVTICHCKLDLNTEKIFSATQLRSYIGYKFIADTEFHHHDDNPYRYPMIQYKRIENQLYVIGFDEFADIVQTKMSGLQHITLKGCNIPIINMAFTKTKHTISDNITSYKFRSPWIALNKENYEKLQTIDETFHKSFLEKILTGNLLSTLKGLDCRIGHELYVKIKWYKHMPITAHKHGFSGFYAEFITNLDLPKHIGIGKSVSKGFGIIQKMKTS